MNKPKTWFLLPIGAVLFAVFLITLNGGSGLDGAAKSTAVVFWFLPTIIWLGYKCFSSLPNVNYSRFSKALLLLSWIVPSIPLCLMSLYGISLLSDTGFGILF